MTDEAHYPPPDEKEFDRHAGIVARLASTSRPPGTLTHTTPMQAAICVITYERTPRNILTQWEIDPEGMVADGEAAFRRFVEVVHWVYEQAGRAAQEGRPDTPETLKKIIPPGYLALLDEAVAQQDLRQSIAAEMAQFVEYLREHPKEGGDDAV